LEQTDILLLSGERPQCTSQFFIQSSNCLHMNSIKALLSLLLFPLFSLSVSAELILLADGDLGSGSASYLVPVGHVATIESVALRGESARLRLGNIELPEDSIHGTITVPAGLVVRVDADKSEDGSVAFAQLNVQAIGDGSRFLPSNTVVIPSNALGNVRIILESSSDLVNWSAADPGSYAVSGAADRRFFRVRAEAQ
jgi:hypothetical protein